MKSGESGTTPRRAFTRTDQTDHDLNHRDHTVPVFVAMSCCAGSACLEYRSNPGNIMLDHADRTVPSG